MRYVCDKCRKECELVTETDYDMEEFWGSPVKRYSSEDFSDCCHATVYEENDDGSE